MPIRTFMLETKNVDHHGTIYGLTYGGPFPTEERAELYAAQNRYLYRFQKHGVGELFAPGNLIKTLTWNADPLGQPGNYKQVMHVIVAHCGKSFDEIDTVHIGPFAATSRSAASPVAATVKAHQRARLAI
jgi:hypothetical protein